MSEHSISIDEIEKKTPFELVGAGRAVPQAYFYDPDYYAEGLPEYVDEQDWHLFIPSPDGELTILRDAKAQKAIYFGVEAESKKDIQIPFLTFYHQHASFPNILEYFDSIHEDIHHLSACLSKIGLYQHLSKESALDITHYVMTELEYIFSVCRSLFDTLHMVARESWSNVQLLEGGKNELPSKLSKMALHGYDPVSASSLVDKYGIKIPLAEYYEELADFLSDLKYYRDSIHHYGGSFDIIFRTDEGIAVSTEREPYSKFDAWNESLINENGLASIWPFISYIVGVTIEFLNRLPGAVFDDVILPDEIAPGYGVFLRGPHVHHLAKLESLCDEEIWGESIEDEISAKLNE